MSNGNEKGTQGARGGRFAQALDPLAAQMNASVSFDQRLLPHDVAGSIAHAEMLARQGIIAEADARAIVTGLHLVQAQFASGGVAWQAELEDVHMNVESQLVKQIGEPGRRLHTARSRNDQVATDMRLYARAQADLLVAALDQLRKALVAQASAHLDTLMPGYTHLQRAQPVRLAHHLLAYVAMLGRDRGRIRDAATRASECPLGSGALAATTFPLDRHSVATALGFADVTHNSLDAVGDRDFIVELVAACGLIAVHLSRLGEEVCLWMSQEFGFATVGEAYCSGSSLMPQKVNPDIAELLRGKTGRVMGAWVALMTTLKGLPLAYNKDLQETQEPLYDAVETVLLSLRVATGMVNSLTFHPERMRAAVDHGYLVATEVADYLVAKGVAFRDAHDIAGAIVRYALAKGVELNALTMQEWQQFHMAFTDDIADWIDPVRAVDRRNVPGGPARSQVLDALARLQRELA